MRLLNLITLLRRAWPTVTFIPLNVLFFGSLFFTAQPLLAQETTEIYSVWRDKSLQAESGQASLGAPGATAAWVLEKVENGPEVRLKNAASGLYLHAETSEKFPALGEAAPGWWSAQWTLEPVEGTDQVRIRNKWRGSYLHTETDTLQLGAIQPGWLSARWQVKGAAPVASPVTTASGTAPEATASASTESLGSMGSGTFPDQISAPLTQVLWRINVAGTLSKSTDAGKSWTDLDKKLAQVSAVSNTVAWGVDFQDKTQHTMDGGATWITLPGEFTQISGVDANVAWAVDKALQIFLSTDHGQTWSKVSGAAQRVSAVSATAVWALNQGNVWRTNDGGKTWSKAASNIQRISAESFDTAWAIDEAGALLFTQNGGKTWRKPAEGYFHACEALGNSMAYALDKDFKLVYLFGAEEIAATMVAPAVPEEEKKAKLTGNTTLDALLQGKKAGEKSSSYGLLSVFNQAGYAASIALAYTDATGLVVKNEQVALGSTKEYQIPAGATNIVMKIEGIACADPLNMEVKFANTTDLQKCYKLWGTIFKTEWGAIACN
ncbi:MAG: hypothetical protein H7Y12_03195 [Sphingobacteriaceae bacterium]|nr:hypothetical protein [Cytophagaceae bacterium]